MQGVKEVCFIRKGAILPYHCIVQNINTLFPMVVMYLTFKSLAVSLRTTRFNIQKFYMALALR